MPRLRWIRWILLILILSIAGAWLLAAQDNAAAPTLRLTRELAARRGPATTYESLGMVAPDVALPILGISPDGAWYLVTLPDGSAGWMTAAGPFVLTDGDAGQVAELTPTWTPTPSDTPAPTATPTPAATATPISTNTPLPTATTEAITVVNGGNAAINVRAGDGTSFSVITTLPPGESAVALGVSSRNSEWVFIEVENGQRGWVSTSVATVNGSTASLPPIAPPTAQAAPPTSVPAATQAGGTRAPTATLAPGVVPTTGPTIAPGTALPTANATPSVNCAPFVPQSPVEGGYANGPQAFYWALAPGATDYWLSIFNEQGANVGLVRLNGVGQTTVIDMSVGAIGGGTFFSWEVTAFLDGRPICTTRRITLPRATP